MVGVQAASKAMLLRSQQHFVPHTLAERKEIWTHFVMAKNELKIVGIYEYDQTMSIRVSSTSMYIRNNGLK